MPPQRIMIIGGANGIGAALTISIVQTSPSALVFMMDRAIDCVILIIPLIHQDSPEGPLSTLLNYPNRMYGHECDVTDPSERQKAVELCASSDILGGIDTVIYCAGVIEPISRISDLHIDDMRYTFEVNLFGLVAIAQLTLSHLRQSRIDQPLNAGYGKLLVLSSACDQDVTYSGWSPYCTSKAALTRFVRCLAHEEKGISVQGVYPKLTRTGMVESLVRGEHRDVMAEHEVERFRIWDGMGEDMIEPPEWCGEAVAKLALGLFEGGKSGETLYYDEHVPKKIDGT